MQNIWAGALRARGACRCSTCISTTTTTSTTIARRTTLATVKRLLPSTPSGTLLYSTIFATAVVADSKIKDKRRDKWDAAISNAKKELEEVSDAVRQAEEEVGGNLATEVLGEQKRTPAEEQILQFNELYSESTRDGAFVNLEFRTNGSLDQNLLQMDPLIPHDPVPWPITAGPILNLQNMPPQSVYNSQERALFKRARISERKRLTLEISMANLVLSLMHAAKLDPKHVQENILNYLPQTVQALAALDEEEFNFHVINTRGLLKELTQASADVVSQSTINMPDWYPSYLEDTRRQYLWTCYEMNEALLRLFHHHSTGQISFATLIGDICHNLLISSAPPDLRTYNILLNSFAKIKESHCCNLVIRSFLESKIRPNEITCSIILRFYADMNMPKKFAHFVSMMRGGRGIPDSGLMTNRGLMLAQPYIKITPAGAPRLMRQDNGTVIQKVYPTPMVFGALMEGALRFGGFSRAWEIYEEMTQDDWALDLPGLTFFLRDCTRRIDWEGGQRVWEEILRLRDVKKIWEKADHLAYYQMLQLCRACQQPLKFQQVLRDAIRAGNSKSNLLRKVYSVKMPDGTSPNPGDGVGDDIEVSKELMDKLWVKIEDSIRDLLAAGRPNEHNNPLQEDEASLLLPLFEMYDQSSPPNCDIKAYSTPTLGHKSTEGS